jgi:hypothetical protein
VDGTGWAENVAMREMRHTHVIREGKSEKETT